MTAHESQMRECICSRCAEREGHFKYWQQCDDCQLYGDEDEFASDNGLCNECAAKSIATHGPRFVDVSVILAITLTILALFGGGK